MPGAVGYRMNAVEYLFKDLEHQGQALGGFLLVKKTPRQTDPLLYGKVCCFLPSRRI